MSNKLPYLLVAMAGQGSRFKAAGYTEPKPFITVSGRPMIQRLLDLFPQNWPAVFVINNQDYSQKHIDYLKKIRISASDTSKEVSEALIEVLSIPSNSDGPLNSVMQGLEVIPDDAPVFVTYCDYGLIWDPQAFEQFVQTTQCDVAIVCYKGFHPHYLGPNMYCYVKTEGNKGNKVIDIKEKECFSANREDDYASTGGYYFKSAGLLRRALKEQIEKKLHWNGEFFTSLAIKALMMSEVSNNEVNNIDVRIFEVPYFFQWGTPEDLKAYEYWNKLYKEKIL